MGVVTTGTATPGDANETTIWESSANAVGIYTMSIDLADMANGDDLILRSYVKVLTGGDYKLAQTKRPTNAQSITYLETLPVTSPYQVKYTYERVAGAVNSLPYRINSL